MVVLSKTVDRRAARRALDDLERLAQSGLSGQELLHRSSARIKRLVPFDACFWSATDPATMLSAFEGYSENMEPACGIYWDYEYLIADHNKFPELARAPRKAATLREATRGKPGRSARHQSINAMLGCEAELRAALVVDEACWGVANLLRERGHPDFSPAEVAFVETAGPTIAAGLRAALLNKGIAVGDDPLGPGVLIFNPRGELVSATPEAQAWLDELDPLGRLETRIGVSVPAEAYAVVVRARAIREARDHGIPRARVRTRTGRWLLLHASCLHGKDGEAGNTALSIQPAKASEVAPLIVQAYGLTPREREVTELIAQGLQTSAIAARLHLSPHTVRDHVKAVLEKVGASNRGELIAAIFTEHYHAPLEESLEAAHARWHRQRPP